jgi:hypothetical protein
MQSIKSVELILMPTTSPLIWMIKNLRQMKNLLLTTIAAVVVVGCGGSKSPEPTIAKAPDIFIYEAARQGKIEAVKQHIATGADVNAKLDRFGLTPLHGAAEGGHGEIAELLIDKGADVNANFRPFHSQFEKKHCQPNPVT